NRQIDLLIEEKVIDQDDADAYRKVLKKIEEQARAEDPVKTWEALDHLRKNLQERADLSAESSLSEASKLEEVKALSEALRQDQSDTAPQIDPQVTAESLKHLRKSVEQRMAANELFHLLASQNIDLDRLSASDLDQGAKRLPQVFLDQTLDAKDIERARKVLDRLRVEPRQLGLLDPQAFQSLKEAVARRKQNPRLLEQVRRELAEKLTDQRPEGGKLDAEQIKRIEQALREAGLDPKRMAFLDADLAQPPGGEVPQRPPQLRQVFFSDQLTEETRVEAIQLATLMFIPDAQMGILNHEALQVLRRASEDGRIETQEIEPILEDLEPHLFEAGVLPPVPEGWMEPFGQKLKLLGLKNDQFLLLDQSSSQCQGSQSLVRLTPEQLRQLQQIAEASGQGQSALADRLQRLADNGLIDPSRLKEMQNAGSITPEQLRQWLAEHGKGLSISQLIRNASRPGRGGVNRGRGDAPMHWKDPTSSEGATFKARALPQAQLEALRKSKLVGVSVGKHKTPTGSKPATSSQALDQTKSEGGSAQQHLILPRHRGVVREYFRRGETSKPPSRLNP
ncbi:MAG: hypothetical protein R3236_04700, partial [Phycisphaeraceae bacterium]|nr:hypothetical protein [Phycisphaeraceae bacterium]